MPDADHIKAGYPRYVSWKGKKGKPCLSCECGLELPRNRVTIEKRRGGKQVERDIRTILKEELARFWK